MTPSWQTFTFMLGWAQSLLDLLEEIPMMMSPPTFLRTALLSFHSRELYRLVARQWKGMGLSIVFYLMLAFTLTQSWTTWKIFNQAHHYLALNQPELAAPNSFARMLSLMITQFPTLALHRGEAQLVGEQPYQVKDQQTGITLLVIDTRDRPADAPEALLRITRHALQFNGSNQSTIAIAKLFGRESRHITSNDVRMMMISVSAALRQILPWITPFILLVFFVLHYMRILFLALICLAIGRFWKLDLALRNYIRLAAVALIPSTLWRTLLLAGTMLFIPPALILAGDLVLVIGYLVFALQSIRKP
jgi:hypothetical protein